MRSPCRSIRTGSRGAGRSRSGVAARQRRKLEALAPYVEKAMARKERMKALADDEIPTFVELGRQIAEQGKETEQQRLNRQKWAATSQVPLQDPLKEKAPAAE